MDGRMKLLDQQKKGILLPIMTDMSVAPEHLLKLTSCGCKTGCQKSSMCGCRRFGIECTSLCSGCNGLNCENIFIVDDVNDVNDK